MSQFNLKSIKTVKFGDVDATGAMQSTLTQLYGVKEGTLQVNIAPKDSTPINIEETPYPFDNIDGNVADPNVQMMLLGITMQQLATIWGGTYAAAGAGTKETVTFAASDETVYKALEVTGVSSENEEVVLSFPRTKLTTGIDGQTITKTDEVGATSSFMILQPINTSTGAVVDDVWYIEYGEAGS